MRNLERRGVALLEIVVALVLVSITGLGLVVLVQQTMKSLQDVQRVERETTAASSTLERLTLLGADALDARQGTSRVGTLDVRVARVDAKLYGVAVSDTLTDHVIVYTVLYRPER